MKYLPNIAGALLGLAFVFFASLVLFHLAPTPPDQPPLVQQFMGVFAPTGWLTMVKVCELVGGILVAIPKTRNFGLLVLGPIVINILAFHILVEKGECLAIPVVLGLLALYLLIDARKKFAALAN